MLPRKTSHTAGDYTNAVIKLLQEFYTDFFITRDPEVWEKWRPDPYFVRQNKRPSPTVQQANNVITILIAETAEELRRFPDYHKNRHSTNPVEWDLVPEWMRVGLVQRLCVLADSFPEDESQTNLHSFYGDGSRAYQLPDDGWIDR
jgi:hypothetical protein